MHEFIRTLRDEHGGMVRLMRILWFKLRAMQGGKGSDFETMERVLTLMTELPDRYHHPREDILFDVLASKSDALRDVIDELGTQHAELPVKGRALRDMLRAACAGHPVRRAHIASAGHDYILAQRWHMHEEEFAVFAAADQILEEPDWQEIEQRAAGLMEEHARRRGELDEIWDELPDLRGILD